MVTGENTGPGNVEKAFNEKAESFFSRHRRYRAALGLFGTTLSKGIHTMKDLKTLFNKLRQFYLCWLNTNTEYLCDVATGQRSTDSYQSKMTF